MFLAKQFDKAVGKINLKHGKYVLKNRIGEVIAICTLNHELNKLRKHMFFPLFFKASWTSFFLLWMIMMPHQNPQK